MFWINYIHLSRVSVIIQYMKRVSIIVLMVILVNSVASAQTKFFPNAVKDSLEIKNKFNIVADTLYHKPALGNSILLLQPPPIHNFNGNVFKKFKYDIFWERMKEPWVASAIRGLFR